MLLPLCGYADRAPSANEDADDVWERFDQLPVGRGKVSPPAVVARTERDVECEEFMDSLGQHVFSDEELGAYWKSVLDRDSDAIPNANEPLAGEVSGQTAVAEWTEVCGGVRPALNNVEQEKKEEMEEEEKEKVIEEMKEEQEEVVEEFGEKEEVVGAIDGSTASSFCARLRGTVRRDLERVKANVNRELDRFERRDCERRRAAEFELSAAVAERKRAQEAQESLQVRRG